MSNYKVYHASLTQAVDAVKKHIVDQGFAVSDEELMNVIGFGPAKPTPGNTNRYHLNITKNGKDSLKLAHFQIYNRGYEVPENMELNLYIS